MKPFIERMIIKNYKSIAYCDVRLGALQFLVGRNGSGKSNFLDALAFIRDSLEINNVEKACDMRGTLFIMAHRHYLESSIPLGMRLEFNLANGTNGIFAFELEKNDNASCEIRRELCVINRNNKEIAKYETRYGKNQHENPERFPPVFPDRFYLQNMNGYDEYRPLYDALHNMKIYNFNPKSIPRIDDIKQNPVLMPDGSNIASVMYDLLPKTQTRIKEYLKNIVPSVSKLETISSEKRVFFMFGCEPDHAPFSQEEMSDGTMRALCVLTALLQERKYDKNKIPVLIGIEEPETGLHARATGALLYALREASDIRQVIVTTHSPDLLDDKIPTSQILPVEIKDGETIVAPMDNISVEIIKEHLSTAGELLRQEQLEPAEISATDKDTDLFL